MVWRVAGSLLVLRDEINAAYPGRSTASDGTIGDTAHQSQGSASDHNPWVHLYGDTSTGVVTALDITHDPAHGVDINPLTDRLVATRDPRIKYVIANGLILSGNDGPSPWVWRPYSGGDPHTNHMHLSVVADARCDDTRPWGIASAAPTPPPEVPEMTPEEIRKATNGDTYFWGITQEQDPITQVVQPGGAKVTVANKPLQRAMRMEARLAALDAKVSQVAGGAVTQEMHSAAILAALQDPAVIAALGAAVASHIHVT